VVATVVDVDTPIARWADVPGHYVGTVHGRLGDRIVARETATRQPYLLDPHADTAVRLPRGLSFLGGWDTDGDGIEEVVVAVDGELRAYDSAGHAVHAAPMPAFRALQHPVGVADLDGDGLPEVVLVQSGAAPETTVFGWDGARRGAAPVWGLALAELDGDPSPELVVSGGAWLDARTLRVEGSLPHALLHDAAPCDLDGDGIDELFVATQQVAEIRDVATGRSLWSHAAPFALGDPTVLRRQTGCVVLVEDGTDDTLVLDAATGATVRRLDARTCPGVAYDRDGTGDEVLLCMRSTLDPVLGVREDERFGWRIGAPQLSDLDGDGVVELALLGERLVVLDPVTGDLLSSDALEVDEAHVADDLRDLDGDGLPEVLTTANGLATWGWTATGLVDEGPLVPGSAVALRHPSVGDLDGDGWFDIVHRPTWRSSPVRLDFRSGSSSVLASLPASGPRIRQRDLDGDGADELITGDSGPAKVFDASGTPLGHAPGVVTHVAAQGSGHVLVLVDGHDVSVQRFRGAALVALGRVTLPEAPQDAWWVGGRLWATVGDDTVSWSPADGSVWRFATPGPTVHAPVVVGDRVYLARASVLEAWPLP
jgi:hypothetical protein